MRERFAKVVYPTSPSEPTDYENFYACRHCEKRIHPQDWSLRYCLDCDVFIHDECEDKDCPTRRESLE